MPGSTAPRSIPNANLETANFESIKINKTFDLTRGQSGTYSTKLCVDGEIFATVTFNVQMDKNLVATVSGQLKMHEGFGWGGT